MVGVHACLDEAAVPSPRCGDLVATLARFIVALGVAAHSIGAKTARALPCTRARSSQIGQRTAVAAGVRSRIRSGIDPRIRSGIDPRIRSGIDPRIRSGIDPRICPGIDPRIRPGISRAFGLHAIALVADVRGRAVAVLFALARERFAASSSDQWSNYQQVPSHRITSRIVRGSWKSSRCVSARVLRRWIDPADDLPRSFGQMLQVGGPRSQARPLGRPSVWFQEATCLRGSACTSWR